VSGEARNTKIIMEINRPKETKSAGGVVLNQKGEVLVISQHGTSWSLPKGHVDGGEDAISAAKREIYEESGITKLQFIRELGSYERYKISKDGEDDKSELKTITMFLFITPEDNLKPVDSENPEARWVQKENVVELLTHPKDKEFFLLIRKEI